MTPFLPLPLACPEMWQMLCLNRREMLRLGGQSLLGFTLATSMPSNAATANPSGERRRARARSCILVFLPGGPSQLETFDPKPDAPSETRSIFPAISTTVPGIRLCEHLPDLAKLAQHFALVRTVWHTSDAHPAAHRYVLTGFSGNGSARPDDRPGIVALAAKYLRPRNDMPAAVVLPWFARDESAGGISAGNVAGVLGKQYDPILVEADPASLDRPIQIGPQNPGGQPLPAALPPQPRATVFRIPELGLHPDITPERFAGRRRLLEEIEQQRPQLLASGPAADMRLLYQQAYDFLGSSRFRETLAVEKEARPLRERYGLNAFGQSCLLARRLIEQGTRFAQVNFASGVVQDSYGWDTHRAGRDTLKDHLLPKLNSGVSALLTDLQDRGLLDETLVVVMGDFGRTPGLSPDGGRGHHPKCYSILLAGGGIHGGLVYGKSDRRAYLPDQDPVEARDVLMTILTLLGVPTGMMDGLPAPLWEGAAPVERLYT